MTPQEFLTEVLGTTHKMPADKVAALFNADGTIKDTAKTDFYAADQARVQEFEAREKTAMDNGYKKAQSEILDMKEKEIKDKYGLTGSKKRGLLEIIDEVASQAASKAATVDPDKIKAHPEYIKMQDELTAQIKDANKTWEEKYKNFEKEVNNEKVFSNISKKADGILSGFGLPEDANLAANQKALLHIELKKYNFAPNGDDYIITDSEGKVVNDQHGHRKNFETLVSEIAGKFWPKKDGQNRSGSGAQNNQQNNNGQTANPWKGKITNDDTYSNAMSKAKTGEERIQIDDAYEEYKSSNGGGQ